MVYKTKGTCSSEIEFEVENGILTDIHFCWWMSGKYNWCRCISKGTAY